jgi:hypothetical protein
MQKHEVQIALIIDNASRDSEEGYLRDSRKIAQKIISYLSCHFDVQTKINFQADQLD